MVMMYVRYPLSLRQVEDILFERGIDICHETIRFWWNRFDPMFADEIRKRRILTRSYSHWRWYLDEVFVQDQWRDALSVACSRSRRRGAGGLCDEAPRSQGGTEVSQEDDETLWPARFDRDRQASLLRCGNESNR